MDPVSMKIIARVRSDFGEKFGIPRQSGLARGVRSTVVLEPEYRNPDVFRGLEEFSRIWLIWEFSENADKGWSPTVRPPRLGGNTRMGVFATRSPFRPNPIGLSCVELISVRQDPELGPVLEIGGADLMDGTPVFDIKPYIPYADAHPEASGGFTERTKDYLLKVEFPEALRNRLPEGKQEAAAEVLSHDPRPSYQHDPDRIYGIRFAGCNLKFRVQEDRLTVLDVIKE